MDENSRSSLGPTVETMPESPEPAESVEQEPQTIVLDWKRSLVLHLLAFFAALSTVFLVVDALVDYEFHSVWLMLMIAPLGLMAAFVIAAWMTGMFDFDDSDQ